MSSNQSVSPAVCTLVKDAVEYRSQAAKQYGADANTFLKFYPGSSDEEAAASQLKVAIDMIFGVQNYTWANVQSSQGNPDVFVYRFTRKVPATGEYVKYGAFHTGEVPYAYDNLKFVNRPWEPTDHQLAGTMSSYWVNFIKTGNPNSQDLPHWPSYADSDKQIMFFGAGTPEAKPLPDEVALDFMQGLMKGK